MQAIVNQTFLSRRRQLAKWGNYIGMGALIAGLFTVAKSPTLSSSLMLVGVLAASIGAFMTNRYVREPRVDQLLSRALDGLDKRYTLLSYYLPVDHVVFSHRGFTIIEARSQDGQIRYANGRWSHAARMRWLKQILGEPSLGSPDKDLAGQYRTLKKWATKQGLQDIPINGAIVFTGKGADLDLQDMPIPAVPLNELGTVLREGTGAGAPLTTSQRRDIEATLDALVHKAR